MSNCTYIELYLPPSLLFLYKDDQRRVALLLHKVFASIPVIEAMATPQDPTLAFQGLAVGEPPPDDAKEQERKDLKHYIFQLVLGGDLLLAPIPVNP